jgi:hypothetical protein
MPALSPPTNQPASGASRSGWTSRGPLSAASSEVCPPGLAPHAPGVPRLPRVPAPTRPQPERCCADPVTTGTLSQRNRGTPGRRAKGSLLVKEIVRSRAATMPSQGFAARSGGVSEIGGSRSPRTRPPARPHAGGRVQPPARPHDFYCGRTSRGSPPRAPSPARGKSGYVMSLAVAGDAPSPARGKSSRKFHAGICYTTATSCHWRFSPFPRSIPSRCGRRARPTPFRISTTVMMITNSPGYLVSGRAER